MTQRFMKHLFLGPVLGGFIVVDVVPGKAEFGARPIPVKLAPRFGILPFLCPTVAKSVKLDTQIVEAESEQGQGKRGPSTPQGEFALAKNIMLVKEVTPSSGLLAPNPV